MNFRLTFYARSPHSENAHLILLYVFSTIYKKGGGRQGKEKALNRRQNYMKHKGYASSYLYGRLLLPSGDHP